MVILTPEQMIEFNALIDQGLKPDEFKKRVKELGVAAVVRGQIATREIRSDHSRFFIRVADEMVVGGEFR